MSEKKDYRTIAGAVIQWPDQDAPIVTKDLNGDELREFTVETINGNNVKVTLWPEFASVTLTRGQFVIVSGTVTQNENKKDPSKPYINMKAFSAFIPEGNVYGVKKKNVVNDESGPDFL